MGAFSQKLFLGLSPRTGVRVRKQGYAEVALDIDLEHGEIRPMRDNSVAQETVPAGTKTIHKLDCCFLTFTDCVSIVDGACDNRYFVTGAESYPQAVSIEDCVLTACRLGMPCEFSAPDVQVVSPTATSKAHAARSYVYCYKNRFGEISAPSLPSNLIYVTEGQAVVVSGFVVQPAEYCIESILIYRTETGRDKGNEATNAANSATLLVAEIPVTQNSYSDTVESQYLGSSLETEGFAPPPADLKGITRIKDMNILFGFSGKQLHFSDIDNFHNWPNEQILTLDDTIRAVAEVDGYIYVATDGYPYTVKGTPGNDGQRDVFRHKVSHRLIGDARSFTTIPSGMVYVSEVGAILLTGTSIPQIITDPYFAASDWQQLQPHAMRLEFWNNHLYIFGRVHSYMMHIDRTGDAGVEGEHLIEISDRPTDTVVDRRGHMFLLQNGRIEQFRNGVNYREYVYRSTEAHLGGNVSLTSGKVTGNGHVEIELFNQWRSRMTRVARMNRMFRLPRQGKWIDVAFELRGTAVVKSVELGGSHVENAGG